MNYAIIAAGEGSRLSQEGVPVVKPLVMLNGETLIDRLIRIFCANGACSISVIINRNMPQVRKHLEQLDLSIPLTIIEDVTPSSMHSFYALSQVMPQGKFCLTTVDTIFNETTFKDYIKAFEQATQIDGLFAVTQYIDDEKPLYVHVAADHVIEGFYDTAPQAALFASGGIYGLTDASLRVLKQEIEKGNARMRNFQRALITEGFRLKAFPFDQIIDVDHASDIPKAIEVISTF